MQGKFIFFSFSRVIFMADSKKSEKIEKKFKSFLFSPKRTNVDTISLKSKYSILLLQNSQQRFLMMGKEQM